MLFMINHQLCKEYPALSPYDIDVKTYTSVIDLYCDVRKIQIKTKVNTDDKGEQIIRKKAGDDWF